MQARDINITPVLWIAALYAGYKVVQHHGKTVSRAFGNIRLSITGVHVEDNDIIITLNLQNPNPVNCEVQSLVGVMYTNGQQVAAIKMFGDYIAKSNGEVTIPLIAKVLTPNIFHQLRELILNRGHVDNRITGTVNINNIAYPVNVNFSK